MEFEDLGKHCAYCQQKDILPFQCNCCKEYYCLEHIRRDAHKCPKANANDNTVIICTKCDQPIQLLADVDASILVEEHIRFNCNPRLKKTVRHCPVPGCKEKLSLVNVYKCEACGKEFCLRHRYKEDHDCHPLATPTWKDKFLSSFRDRVLKVHRFRVYWKHMHRVAFLAKSIPLLACFNNKGIAADNSLFSKLVSRAGNGTGSSTPFIPSRKRDEKYLHSRKSCRTNPGSITFFSPFIARNAEAVNEAAAYAIANVAEPPPSFATTTSSPAY